jgi:hypothetical protein
MTQKWAAQSRPFFSQRASAGNAVQLARERTSLIGKSVPTVIVIAFHHERQALTVSSRKYGLRDHLRPESEPSFVFTPLR